MRKSASGKRDRLVDFRNPCASGRLIGGDGETAPRSHIGQPGECVPSVHIAGWIRQPDRPLVPQR